MALLRAQLQTNIKENLQNEIVAALKETLQTDHSPEELSTMVNDRLFLKYIFLNKLYNFPTLLAGWPLEVLLVAVVVVVAGRSC